MSDGAEMEIFGPCSYNAKYRITMTTKRKKTTIMNVCGVHRNSKKRHCANVGITYRESHLTPHQRRQVGIGAI